MMKRIWIYMAIVALAIGCKSRQGNQPDAGLMAGMHRGEAKEVLQTGEYTYLLLAGADGEQWVAVPKMDAETGQTYYYGDGLQMDNFSSKELNRQFESVLFLERVTTSPPMEQATPQTGMMQQSPGAITTEKEDIKIEADESIVTLSQLFENPSAYEGKMVRVKGKVTKFNPAIMNTNWLHIQDGTEANGKYDLTITSKESFQTGDTVTLEGTITLNKDFGYGYKYEVLLEGAKAVK